MKKIVVTVLLGWQFIMSGASSHGCVSVSPVYETKDDCDKSREWLIGTLHPDYKKYVQPWCIYKKEVKPLNKINGYLQYWTYD